MVICMVIPCTVSRILAGRQKTAGAIAKWENSTLLGHSLKGYFVPVAVIRRFGRPAAGS